MTLRSGAQSVRPDMAREWERALERQLALIDYLGTGHAAVWTNLFTRLYRSQLAPEPFRKDVLSALGHADTYFVSDEMTSLVEKASMSIGDPVLEAHVPFTPSGFAYFQRPITVWWTDESRYEYDSVHGRRYWVGEPTAFGSPPRDAKQVMQVRGILWQWKRGGVIPVVDGQMKSPVDGVAWWLFGYDTQLSNYQAWMEDPRDPEMVERMTAQINRDKQTAGQIDANDDVETVDAAEIVRWADRIDDLCYEHGVESFRPAPDGLMMIEASSWTAGQAWNELSEAEWVAGMEQGRDVHEIESASHVWFQVARVRRFMYALWSIMAQPISTPMSQTPNRDYRRRWERTVTTPPNYGDVRVVTLRRSAQAGPAESDELFGREFSHRWIVRGFWRNQWYPSEGVHRLIWIDSYVKGPEDKPLIIKDSVYEVVR